MDHARNGTRPVLSGHEKFTAMSMGSTPAPLDHVKNITGDIGNSRRHHDRKARKAPSAPTTVVEPYQRHAQGAAPFLQPFFSRPFKRRRRTLRAPSPWNIPILLLFFFTVFASRINAAFINFDNCLDQNIVNSSPLQLQWIPLWVNARFVETSPSHNLNITIQKYPQSQ